MIRLDALTDLLAGPGPYATAYLDASLAKEHGPQEVDARWRALRSSLAEQGADDATLDAMQAAVGRHTEVPGEHGQLLVGAGGRLRYDVALPEVPPRPIATWSPLPELMPMVAQLGARLPYVLALVDRAGAEVAVVGPDRAYEQRQTVQGGTYPIHKAKVGGWSELRFLHRAEDLWESNARQVAEVVESAVHGGGARVVVLAGDVRAREVLRKVLDERSAELVVELHTGGRADGIDADRLAAEVDAVVARAALDADQAVLDRFAEAYGRARSGVGDVLAAAGVADTVAALRQAQVDTLLLVDDPSSTLRAWTGPEPVHLASTREELAALGVTDPVADRLDSALVRAAAGTDAGIVTLAPGQLDLPEGIGATLRYPSAR